jgi:hypothetical protein
VEQPKPRRRQQPPACPSFIKSTDRLYWKAVIRLRLLKPEREVLVSIVTGAFCGHDKWLPKNAGVFLVVVHWFVEV